MLDTVARRPGGRSETAPGRARVAEIARRLKKRYGGHPDETSEPLLDQLIWFMLSTRTTTQGCEQAYAGLRASYPEWNGLEGASIETVAPLLRPAGLMRARAAALAGALKAIRKHCGEGGLESMRQRSDTECEEFLLSLPGVGLKVARCVMAFGLGRRAFAVDAHIWRITRRLGWHSLPNGAPSRRGSDLLQAIALSARDPLSLHVNFIQLGRELCRPATPRCDDCPLRDLCPNYNLPLRKLADPRERR